MATENYVGINEISLRCEYPEDQNDADNEREEAKWISMNTEFFLSDKDD